MEQDGEDERDVDGALDEWADVPACEDGAFEAMKGTLSSADASLDFGVVLERVVEQRAEVAEALDKLGMRPVS